MQKQYSSKFKNVLTSIKSLLLDEQNIGQARVIDILLQSLEKKNYLEFEREVNSINIWGGAGSVLDVYFENSILQKKFHNQLLILIDLMKGAKIINPSLNLSKKIWF